MTTLLEKTYITDLKTLKKESKRLNIKPFRQLIRN